MIKNKKALSPIFATLAILAVVTTLFVPVFIWASGITSRMESSRTSFEESAAEKIVVEKVSLVAGLSNCSLFIRNIGRTSISINDVIFSRANTSQVIQTYSKAQFSTSPTYITQGNLLTLTIPNLGFALQKITYSIQVFTSRGVGDSLEVVIT